MKSSGTDGTSIMPGDAPQGSVVRAWLPLWGPVLVWMAVVLLMSTDWFSGAHTGTWLLRILRRAFPEIDIHWVGVVNQLGRKIMHGVEYGILGGLTYRALRVSHLEWSRFRCLASALLLAASWAMVDEGCQSYVPSRGSSLWDVAMDTFGAGLGAVVLSWWRRRHGWEVWNPPRRGG